VTLDEARECLAAAGAGEVRVVYQPGHGPAEEGVITRVTERFVFVRYGTDVGSKATRADCLVLAGAP
jgi:hypothetical protein